MNFSWILAIAALSGGIALSYEIIWYRAYSLVSWSSPAAFGLLLGAYLLGIAAGSAWARYFCTKRTTTEDRRHLLALAGFLAISNLISYAVVPTLGWLVVDTHWVRSLYLVAIATTFLGAILPLLSHFGVSPDAHAGKNLSYIYLANILGSASGSLLTGFVLMEHLSIRSIHILLFVAGTCLASAIVIHAVPKRTMALSGIGGLAAIAISVASASGRHFDDLYERLLYKHRYAPDLRFAEIVENRSGVIAVTHSGNVYGSGAYDGKFNTSLLDDRNGIVRAFAAGALHAAPKDVLMIGLSTGSWAQVLAHHPGMERMTVVEINHGYPELIAKHTEVASVLKNPKISIVFDDGRRWLKRNPDRKFDAIIMNTTWHFRSLATNLLSREFLETLRGHLNPGGIAYYNTTGSDSSQKTGATVFPHALRFLNFMAVSDSPLQLDPKQFEDLLVAYRIEGQSVLDLSRADHQQMMAKIRKMIDEVEPRDKLLERVEYAPLITDDNMVTEWHSKSIPPEIDAMSYFRSWY